MYLGAIDVFRETLKRIYLDSRLIYLCVMLNALFCLYSKVNEPGFYIVISKFCAFDSTLIVLFIERIMFYCNGFILRENCQFFPF